MGVMAFKARSSVIFFSLIVLLALSNCGTIEATKYVVGDEFHWDLTIDMESWPNGKTFYVGDVLEFIYDYQSFDVVVTDKIGHDTCTVTQNSTVHSSGHDLITLPFGTTYYMCSIATDCQSGMKMAIYAKNPPPPQHH